MGLKEIFDKVDRGKLEEILKKIGIKKQLRKEIMEIMETYKKMKNIIKVGNRKTEELRIE